MVEEEADKARCLITRRTGDTQCTVSLQPRTGMGGENLWGEGVILTLKASGGGLIRDVPHAEELCMASTDFEQPQRSASPIHEQEPA